MMPQTLPDNAMVEVVVENQKGESATLTGALQDATAAEGAKNKWEAGKTYTYTINLSGVTAVITFSREKIIPLIISVPTAIHSLWISTTRKR